MARGWLAAVACSFSVGARPSTSLHVYVYPTLTLDLSMRPVWSCTPELVGLWWGWLDSL